MSSEWIQTTWGELASLEYGKGIRGYQEAIAPYRVYGTNGPVGWHTEPLCHGPGVVIGRKGAYRGVHFSPAPFYVIDTAFYLRPKVAIDVRWAYYQLLTVDINAMDSGSAIPSTSRDEFYKLPVVVPPIAEQAAIADLLARLDERIALLRETNATLESIAQALFKSWFVDFDPVRAKRDGRAPEGMDEATAALFPDSLEDSALGEVPRGWRVSTLDGISDVGIGKTPPRKEAQWFSEDPADVPWVSIRDMGAVGSYIGATSEYLTASAVDRFNVRRVPDNTVLLSFKLTIGRVAISDGELTTNEAIAHCRLTPGSPLPTEYIYLHLKQFNYSTLSSTSSIADAVNSKTVKAIPILVPSADVVAAFAGVTASLFQRIRTAQAHAETLTALRDTLLPRLISGQLRLPDATEIVEEALA